MLTGGVSRFHPDPVAVLEAAAKRNAPKILFAVQPIAPCGNVTPQLSIGVLRQLTNILSR